MGLIEDILIFLTQRGEIVHVKKSSIVDVIGSHSPIGEAIGLRFDELVKSIEGTRITHVAIHLFDDLFEELRYITRTGTQGRQPALVNLFITQTLRTFFRSSFLPPRQMIEG